ncbi:MAG: hypothetical protein ACRES4_11155 [Nevskiales bacterium]
MALADWIDPSQVFGVLEDYPQGYNCHFLSKWLEPSVPDPA